jgi:hypothetical protein
LLIILYVVAGAGKVDARRAGLVAVGVGVVVGGLMA